MIVDLFAGPGGWDKGAQILGLREPIHGYDIDADACATATAAGFLRTQASVTDLDPDAFHGTTGAIVSPPCPTFSAAGKRSALQERDYRAILDAIVRLGDSQAGLGADDAYAAVNELVGDKRSALVVEALRFALQLPDVQWVAAEQVPAVAPIWQEMCAEMAAAHDYESCHVVTLHGEDFGLPNRRPRVILIATRTWTPNLGDLPVRSWWSCGRFQAPHQHAPTAAPVFPTVTMADVLDWPAGERINTRGARKTSGGNEFSADGPGWCVTGKIRSWKRVSDGARFTPAQSGMLTGFPADHPWQGSQTKAHLQAADVVPPPMAAAVLGTALGIPWRALVADYLASIYSGRALTAGFQPYLFETAVA